MTGVLVYRYAVDPRHLEHHPSLHGGTAALHRSGSGAKEHAAGAPGGADVEAQGPARRPGSLSWQQVVRDVRSVLSIRSFQVRARSGKWHVPCSKAGGAALLRWLP